jgi:hypothetical protein
MFAAKRVIMLIAVGLFSACSEAPQSAASVEPDEAEPVQSEARYDPLAIKERAAASLQPFKQQLMQALQSGMRQGAENAIDVCRLEAPVIAAAASGEGVEIGRSSHRVRNPANAPSGWQQQAIDHYLGSEDREPMVMDLGNNQLGYAEPIITAPMCLVCHGRELSGEVRQALSVHYPDDQATGFSAGDLRGIFWVSLPAAQASAGSGE